MDKAVILANYMEKAKKEYKRRRQQEVEDIAIELYEEDERKKKVEEQNKCSHSSHTWYSHGRYKICDNCGKDL